MEQFKLRSIDQFDMDFIELIKNEITEKTESIPEAVPETAPEVENEPKVFIEEPQNKPEDISSVSDYGEDVPEAPEEKPENPFANGLFGAIDDDGDDDEDDAPKGKLAGIVIAKIVSLVLLAATVLLFISGCFVSIFLDNNGTDIAGYCFNTLSKDVNQLEISKGALIISKKVEMNEINSQDIISVPAANNESGCDVQIVDHTYQNGSENVIFTIASEENYGFQSSVDHNRCYGKVKRYIPAVGGMVSFAMENAILVCVLFILLAALWCLLLIVLEKKHMELKRLYGRI